MEASSQDTSSQMEADTDVETTRSSYQKNFLMIPKWIDAKVT